MIEFKLQAEAARLIHKGKYYFYYQWTDGWLLLSTDSGKLYFKRQVTTFL